MTIRIASIDDDMNLPAAVREQLAANLADPATVEGASLNSTFVQKGSAAQQKIGNGADPNSVTTQDVKLLVTANRVNPNKVIEQHLVGYSFYSGNPGPGVGSLQGGSCESYVFANGSSNWGTALGFEGIARSNGDQPRTIQGVIGLQGTAYIEGTPTVALAVSLRARGVDGSGAVAEARSLDVQEPRVGTIRRAIYSVGTARFRRGTAGNAFEISAVDDVLGWASSGSSLFGYDSDGTSVRIQMNPKGSNTRILSRLFGSGKHLSFENNSAEVLAVSADGKFNFALGMNSTSATAGANGAPPAQVQGYLSVQIGGFDRKIPLYLP